ncbi:enoyl-CoA hydratase/isomerase family protein [Psychrobacillus sp. MER TA 171]|uniref:enoyl-CoA hydratase/isomerase family protein n=1 Tax=Psychrobacillus sp. MER TA 171 TaxID=2939577 RepID=UPI00204120CC|nr:enoyl-CoA hydratase/isomerase family protein [Psychrobacillus sp. MER TA 171]MCM3358040.1 enoyl-CoA hydratase/isomerase family protein [Psychrobacillus sp. MER TA 171]
MTNEVLFSINDNGIATITLNRPKALNSLSYEMVKQIERRLKEWQADDNICLVILQGEGEKGFCAGGDIKALYQSNSSDSALQEAKQFFKKEYEADRLIYTYPKPIIACLDGIVMGGGVGLSYGAGYKIVTERTKWAMPEMNIAFFPDVGAAYFLNKAPGYIGRYLALTASVITAPDILYIKAANIYMTQQSLGQFIQSVTETNWQGRSIQDELSILMEKYASLPIEESELKNLEESINEHFSFNTMEGIISSLEDIDDSFAKETKKTLFSKSPFSLKITLKQLIDGQNKTIEECLATDLTLAKNFLKHQDFFEGVRTVLIDKGQKPQFKYEKLSDVSEIVVNDFFKPI